MRVHLIDALRGRRTARDFSAVALPDEVLGALLWAACGVNRPDSGGRTAPSPLGVNEIEVYAALAEGVYRYRPAEHCLQVYLPRDVLQSGWCRALVGRAPLHLFYMADLFRMKPVPPRHRELFIGISTGAIIQNVCLACAALGLSTSVSEALWQDPLAKALLLRLNEKPVAAQTIGFPATAAVASHEHALSRMR